MYSCPDRLSLKTYENNIFLTRNLFKQLIWVIPSLFLFLYSCQKDDPDLIGANLYGTVFNLYEQPLAKAKIEFDGRETVTDDEGKFRLDRLPLGKYQFTASSKYYLSETVDITLTEAVDYSIEFHLKKDTDFLVLSDTSVFLPMGGKEYEIHVESNDSWTIVNNSNWLNFSTLKGSGNASFIVSCNENKDEHIRTDSVFIQTASTKKKIEFIQDVQLKLLNYDWSIGNVLKGNKDSVHFTFNKVISPHYVSLVDDYCFSDLDFKSNEERNGFSCTGFCRNLGEELKISFNISDTSGNILRDTVHVNLYDQKFTVKGGIKKMIIDDDNFVWVLTDNRVPGKTDGSNLTKFLVTENKVAKELEVDLKLEKKFGNIGGDFFINPYNDLIYVINIGGERLDLYSLSGEFVKSVPVPLLPDGNDNYRFPKSVGFNKSGLGILVLTDKSGNDLWTYIDSSRDHEITVPPYDHIYANRDFSRFKMDFSKEKIFINDGNFWNQVLYYDNEGKFGEVQLRPFYENGNCSDIIVNRKQGNKYVIGQYYQQVFSPDFSVGSHLSYELNFLADFSYRGSNPFIIFGMNGQGSIFGIDYNQGVPLFLYETSGQFNWIYGPGIKTTLNDEFLVLYSSSDGNNDLSFIYFIDTDKIWQNI